MQSDTPYHIPARTHRVEQELKKSRFIATLGHAQDTASAESFIAGVRLEYPDASHNCWAYMAGKPGNTLNIGMSDDGEPHGTAGRPMLNVLQQNTIGEIVAVVTRYFGGTKLGAGGLVRAYSGAVAKAMDTLPVKERITYVSVKLNFSYAHENPVRHLLGELELEIEDAQYGDTVVFALQVPSYLISPLEDQVRELTAGAVAVEVVQEAGI